jgi:superfamily II DNA or RNA helicase
MIKDAAVESDFESPVSIDYGQPIPLYPYQEKAVEAVKNGYYGILQSKAGSGKTQMGIALIKEYGRRALWLTHTADLLNQSKERAERYMDSSLIGKITEGKVDIGKGVTFATIQTMCKLDLSQYKHTWDVVIVDECHRVAGTPTQMSMFAKVLNSLSARHKFGLSATVHRSDGMIQATFALLGDVVYTVPDEAVADKVMQVGIKPIGTGVKISRECLNTDGTLNYAKLINYLCEDFERGSIIRNHIIGESGKSCLILSDRLEHLEALKNSLPLWMRGEAVMISGKMTSKKGKAEREQALEDMRVGKKKYLFATYSLAKEGLDIPRLERLFMTTPQKDYAVITQSIGRIARTYEGKADPICYDFVDDIGYLVKSYKKRCTTYKKNDCYFITENQ